MDSVCHRELLLAPNPQCLIVRQQNLATFKKKRPISSPGVLAQPSFSPWVPVPSAFLLSPQKTVSFPEKDGPKDGKGPFSEATVLFCVLLSQPSMRNPGNPEDGRRRERAHKGNVQSLQKLSGKERLPGASSLRPEGSEFYLTEKRFSAGKICSTNPYDLSHPLPIPSHTYCMYGVV